MTSAPPPDPIPVEERRQALERVLASRTFSRSERLPALRRYVCEAELEGRAQQINEYAPGVSVLGRPPEYSPAGDSSVRTRAYQLRNKLRSPPQKFRPRDTGSRSTFPAPPLTSPVMVSEDGS
jgi:hypothetical protein